MRYLLLALAGAGLFVGVMLIAVAVGLWVSWWAAKIWLLLVVPTTGWPALSWIALFGISLTWSVLRLAPTDKKDDDESINWTRIIAVVLAAPLSYLIALVVARVLL